MTVCLLRCQSDAAARNGTSECLFDAFINVIFEVTIFHNLAALTGDHFTIEHFLNGASNFFDVRLLVAARTLLAGPVFKAEVANENFTINACALHRLADETFANLANENVNRLNIGLGLDLLVEILSVGVGDD